jgi:glycosyltransferase involved in cell wall biosynthesis
MQLVGCVITYNDMPLIAECINSLIGKVDRIIVIDGRYRDFPGQGWDSTDGTLEYLSSLDIDLISSVNADEVGKRNSYLDQLSDGDICLNLDSDEILKGSIPELTADFGIIDLADGHSKHVQKRATRFFKYRDGMKYANVHYTLYYNNRQINTLKRVINPEFSTRDIKEFYLLHNWHRRSSQRRQLKSTYYKKLVKNERGYPR